MSTFSLRTSPPRCFDSLSPANISRSPAAAWTSVPWYCHEALSYRFLWVPAAEKAIEFIRVFEVLDDEARRIRVVDYVLLEVSPVFNDVIDDRPEKHNLT